VSADAQYTATTGQFNEDKGAAGRVASITSAGGQLMQLAETRAKQAANRSGLMNSSMAVGAGQKAVIDAATPLAQTDAQLYQQQNLTNQSSLNEASARNAATRASVGMDGLRLDESGRQFDVNEAGTNARFGAEFGERSRQFDTSEANNNAKFGSELGEKSRQFDAGETNQNNRFDVEQNNRLFSQARDIASRETIARLDGDQRMAAISLENTWRKDLNANEKLSGAWGTMMESMNQIQTNPELEPENKKELVQQKLDQFGAYAKWTKSVSGVDVSELLVFNTAPPMSAAPGAPTAPVGQPRGGLPGGRGGLPGGQGGDLPPDYDMRVNWD
jgi:hypothetical protein